MIRSLRWIYFKKQRQTKWTCGLVNYVDHRTSCSWSSIAPKVHNIHKCHCIFFSNDANVVICVDYDTLYFYRFMVKSMSSQKLDNNDLWSSLNLNPSYSNCTSSRTLCKSVPADFCRFWCFILVVLPISLSVIPQNENMKFNATVM